MLKLARLIGAIPCILIALVVTTSAVSAQEVASSGVPAPPNGGSASVTVSPATPAKPSSAVGPLNGLNFSVAENAEHDSSTGWSDYLTPNLSFRVNRNVWFDTGFPWYLSLAAYVPSTVNGTTTSTLTQVHNVIGDAAVAAHATGSTGDLNLGAAAAVGFPTGDKSVGVGAGQATWHFGTHADYSIGHFSPQIEAGIGNSSAFANRVVTKSYTAVGQIANFQAGVSIDLPKQFSLDLNMYEAMPLQAQTIFGTIGRGSSHSHAGGKRTLQGTTASGEDNGFNMDLSFPITRKLSFSADYEHSLIQAEDIVGFSLNWTLRARRNADAMAPVSPLARR